MDATPDYRSENERRRRAIEKENEFLKKEVMGQGADEDIRDHAQNAQSNIERTIESADQFESESEQKDAGD